MTSRLRAPFALAFCLGPLSLAWVACVGSPPIPPSRPSPPKVAASAAQLEALPAPSAAPSPESSTSAAPDDAVVAPLPGLVCNPQQAFEWLERKSYIPVKQRKKEHDKALRYRTENYGYVKGFGEASWNAARPKDQAVATTVFGLPTTVHKKIVPALRCVEEEIKATCGAFPYKPGVLSGLRDKNTYRAGEVTNHLYGIALDIDPLLNSCCGCVKKWQASPLCKKKAKTIWERMSMPKCWVDAFEKYGFYWLGHDTLKDTMHFEFLADPDRVLVSPATTKVIAASSTTSPSLKPQ